MIKQANAKKHVGGNVDPDLADMLSLTTLLANRTKSAALEESLRLFFAQQSMEELCKKVARKVRKIWNAKKSAVSEEQFKEAVMKDVDKLNLDPDTRDMLEDLISGAVQ